MPLFCSTVLLLLGNPRIFFAILAPFGFAEMTVRGIFVANLAPCHRAAVALCSPRAAIVQSDPVLRRNKQKKTWVFYLLFGCSPHALAERPPCGPIRFSGKTKKNVGILPVVWRSFRVQAPSPNSIARPLLSIPSHPYLMHACM